jgi:hypothetical protein
MVTVNFVTGVEGAVVVVVIVGFTNTYAISAYHH